MVADTRRLRDLADRLERDGDADLATHVRHAIQEVEQSRGTEPGDATLRKPTEG